MLHAAAFLTLALMPRLDGGAPDLDGGARGAAPTPRMTDGGPPPIDGGPVSTDGGPALADGPPRLAPPDPRLEQARADIETLTRARRALDRARTRLQAEHTRRLARLRRDRTQATERRDALLSGTRPADAAAFDEVARALDAQLTAAEEALDARAADPIPQIARTRPPVIAVPAAEMSDALRDALQQRARLVAEVFGRGSARGVRQALLDAHAARALDLARGHAAVAAIDNAARLFITEHAKAPLDDELHTLSDRGVENVRLALRHLALSLRTFGHHRLDTIRGLPDEMRDLVKLGRISIQLAKAAVLLLLLAWWWRQSPRWLERVRAAVLRGTTTGRARFYGQLIAVLGEVVPRGLVIATALGLRRIFTPIGPGPELRAITAVVVWIASYQITARLTHMLILRLARRRLLLGVRQKLKILRSVRLVMRFGFVAAFILMDTAHFAGHGVLYEGVRGLLVLVGLLLWGVLLVRWRADIIDTYLDGWPQTRLARAISSSRNVWVRTSISIVALVVVAAQAAAVLGRDFLLGFEHIQRALAYVFLLRIERKAKTRGHIEFHEDALPASVREGFAPGPPHPSVVVDSRWADIPRIVDRILKNHGEVRALVVGPRGIGCTAWMQKLDETLAGQTERFWMTPTTRITTERMLVRALSHAFDIQADAYTTVDALAEILDERFAGHPVAPVLFIDDAQLLYLRCIGGFEGLDAVTQLMRRLYGRLTIVVAMSEAAYRYLAQTRHLTPAVMDRVMLGPWSESEIRALIQNRQRRSGVSVSFSDLLVEESAAGGEHAQVVETQEEYLRLLWNFAEGNPWVAQHFWLRSLVPGPEDKLSVQLYRTPGARELDFVTDDGAFCLHAFCAHGRLTLREVADATGLSIEMVEQHIQRGLDVEMYRVCADSPDHAIDVDVHWWPAVVRFLRRRNLL